MQVMVYFAAAVLFLILGAFVLAVVLSVIKVGSSRWDEASSLSGSMATVLAGEVEGDRDGLRDPRIAKGKVWKKATSTWVPQGKLADEYIKNMAS
jgi:hypothetical protein